MSGEIVYGRNAVAELLNSNPDRISKIYFQFNTNEKRILELFIKAKQHRISIGKASNQKLGDLAKTNKHQGVVAITSDVKMAELDDLLQDNSLKPFFFVLLDGIEDPHNLGAIIRTAECAGATAILLPKDKSAPINSTVHKTSAGAVSHARLCRIGNVAQTIDRLKKQGVWVVGADAKAKKTYAEFDFTTHCCLVIGSEGKGMRDLVKKSCDELVSIPMFGKTASLNASVSAGVLLYEVVRQRQTKKAL
ncbi:MAG: 23S rRNA (guanosine(2251)-2'-O)-methyltransferase RlmB [Chloroherpetonaceae bacterium]|nr:23S rRNA (guanosine(2251)-2'-O)-methyltransferase RlmB [Chloroherpetonaceae bacterium]MDW8438653.1 23S rRNA (guanosine(2251)-2'-O)-methyltransferase RlmB [Chloroherpetonaceae bacterium]